MQGGLRAIRPGRRVRTQCDIALNSRVAGYRRSMLESLLYQRRELVDYFDKNLAIFAVKDWPYFARERARYAQNTRGGAELACACATVLDEIARRGALCSADIDLPGKVDWFWSATRTARAALEQLYFEGRLAIHHKRGTVKYYDLIERCLPADMVTAPDPLPDDEAHRQWRVLRRVGAVGLLWNRASDAWLGIPGLKAGERESAFAALCARGELTELEVEGVRWPLYMRACDEAELERRWRASLRRGPSCLRRWTLCSGIGGSSRRCLTLSIDGRYTLRPTSAGMGTIRCRCCMARS